MPNMETLESAKRAIEAAMASRNIETQAASSFASTDLRTLEPICTQSEVRRLVDLQADNSLRAAVQMCLTAALAALSVSQKLMKDIGNLTPRDRVLQLKQCEDDCRAISEAALKGCTLMLGCQEAESDLLMEMRCPNASL